MSDATKPLDPLAADECAGAPHASRAACQLEREALTRALADREAKLAALLDLRKGIEELELYLFSYATGTGQQTRPKSGREMAEQVAKKLRALLPQPTTERGAPPSE